MTEVGHGILSCRLKVCEQCPRQDLNARNHAVVKCLTVFGLLFIDSMIEHILWHIQNVGIVQVLCMYAYMALLGLNRLIT